MRTFRAGIFGAAVLVVALGLLSCGGGGGSTGNSSATPQPTPGSGGTPQPSPDSGGTPQPVSGGTAAAPAAMSFDNKNEIKADAFDNYFKITASAGDTIIIKSTLVNAVQDRDVLICNMNSDYMIQIVGRHGACSLNLKFTFDTSGEYTVHFKYPQANYGYFNAAIIPAAATFSPTTSATGKPDDPRTIVTGGADNQLSENDFYNNFIYDAKAGDTIHIQIYPDTLPSSQDALRCNMSGGGYEDFTSFGVLTSDTGKFNCDQTFDHTFAQAGRYYLNIRFIHGVKGFLRAVVVPAI